MSYLNDNLADEDIYEGSHAEFAANESFVSDNERAWLRWVRKVELLLGHSLDGNQETDGYSLDYAHDAFMNRETPKEYVDELLANPAYNEG